MGSIQQVAMAAVCLVAAFAFGSFINQSPTEQAEQAQLAASNTIESFNQSEITVQKKPADTPWMKPKLSPRLPMPVLDNDSSTAYQSAPTFNQRSSMIGEIPPPNDLSGRINSVENQNSQTPPWSTTPTASPLVNAAPNFGFGSGKSSMPVVAKQGLSHSPNLADSMRMPSQSEPNDQLLAVENAPVFAVAEFGDASPLPTPQGNQQPSQPMADNYNLKAPSFPPLDQRTEPHTVSRPTMPTRQTIQSAEWDAENISPNQQPTTIITAPEAVSAPVTPNRFGSNSQEGQTQVPSRVPTVTIDDPGGAFGNRDPQPRWAKSSQPVFDNNVDSNQASLQPRPELRRLQSERRVNRLPLQLNSNAKSNLTRLRDNTINKISLDTTRFSEYEVVRGDSLQSIASKIYGKPDFYLDIYLANRDRLRFPGDVREGMTINIPVYE